MNHFGVMAMDHIVTLDGYQEAAPSGHGGKLTVSFGSQQSAGPAARSAVFIQRILDENAVMRQVPGLAGFCCVIGLAAIMLSGFT